MVRGFRSSDKMHFSYHVDWVEEKGKKVPIHRPRIEIVLRKRSEKADPETNPEFRTYGLIDSGADICFLPRVIANVLKLDLKEETKKESTSASGKFSTYRTEMYLEIMDKGRKIGVDTVKVAVNVKDPEGLNPEQGILLGRQGLFGNYEITINEKSQFVKLKRISKSIR